MTSDSNSEVAKYLASAKQLLEITDQGYRDFVAGGDRRPGGIYSVVSTGRAFTQAVQRLRSRVDGFDDWWSGWQAWMRADPVFSWFWDLRNEMEKRGKPSAGGRTRAVVSSTGSFPRLGPGESLHIAGDHGRNYIQRELPDGSMHRT